MTEELLRLENIYKNFGAVKVLKDINIKINKGEVVALIGDNGAGKSTLIKVITGVHRPTSGKVFLIRTKLILNQLLSREKWGSKLFIKKELFVTNKNYGEIFLQVGNYKCVWIFRYKKTTKRS